MIIQGKASLPDSMRQCQVVVQGNRIAAVLTEPESFESPDIALSDDQLICPGFIDPQINGGFGKEFKTDTDALDHVTREIVRYGVTSIMPTVTTMDQERYSSHINGLLERYSGPNPNARVLGVHLEGPVLNPKKRGAHPEESLLTPDNLALDGYLIPHVRMVTIAPELPKAWDLATQIVERGIRLGLGHSLATYQDVVDNFSRESMHIVHAFNAMGEYTGRQPGLVGVALDRPDFYTSVIADLVHVHPAALRLLWRVHGDKSTLFGISDGSAVLGLPEGNHKVGLRQIERRRDRAVLSGTETLVGSVLTMNMAARNMRAATQCHTWEAVNFVTKNTASYLGVEDEVGSIEAEKFADLCIIDSDFNVLLTVVDGSIVYNQLK